MIRNLFCVFILAKSFFKKEKDTEKIDSLVNETLNHNSLFDNFRC